MVLTLLLTALAPAVWGTTYVITTELLPPDRPLLAAAIRVLPIGLAMVAWNRQLPRGDWWWRATVLGLCNVGAFQALLFVGAYRLPGGVAATAGAILPLVVAGLAAWLLADRFRLRTAVAGLAGVAGVGLLVLGPEAALDPIGVVAALAGTLSGAMGIVLTKRWGRPAGLVTMTGWQLTAGGLFLAPLALAVEGAPPALTLTNVAGYAWLAVVGTGLAYALWFRGIERLPITAPGFLALCSPIVATLLGWAVLDQALTPVQFAGALLVVAAVVGGQARTRPTPAPTPPTAAAAHAAHQRLRSQASRIIGTRGTPCHGRRSTSTRACCAN